MDKLSKEKEMELLKAIMDKYNVDEYWAERVLYKEEFLIVKGVCYYISEESTAFKGYGGRRHIIRYLDTGKIRITDNLWHNGDVPEAIKEELPDNAEFLSSMDYCEYLKVKYIDEVMERTSNMKEGTCRNIIFEYKKSGIKTIYPATSQGDAVSHLKERFKDCKFDSDLPDRIYVTEGMNLCTCGGRPAVSIKRSPSLRCKCDTGRIVCESCGKSTPEYGLSENSEDLLIKIWNEENPI